MPRRTLDDEEWDGDDEDWRDSFDDDDSDDEESTVPCPYCDRSIPEDVPRCPYCEKYISAEDAPPARKPWWKIVGVLICLYIIYRWTTG
jgi:hypothetical protein